MTQYEVLKYGYSQLLAMLTARGKESGLFTVTDAGEIPAIDKDRISVNLSVTDICQLKIDKTGQRIIVNEMLYDLPTLAVCTVGIHIYARQHMRALEAAGSIIAYLKDNPVIPLESYNWHGNTTDKMFIESVVREPLSSDASAGNTRGLYLLYKIEAGINSEKGTYFKRVEKREIRSEPMNDKGNNNKRE